MASFGPIVVVSVPVSDVDRSKTFFVDILGFHVETDIVNPTMRWVQLAPPEGGTSIALVTWFDAMKPGSLRGVVLATDDIEAKRADLMTRGLTIAEIDNTPYGRFANFDDPDGNGFILMQPPEGMTRD